MGSRQVKARMWARRLLRFDRVGQSVAAFCREEGISQGAFYYWKKRLADSGGTTQYGPMAKAAPQDERNGPMPREGGRSKSRPVAGGAIGADAGACRNTAWPESGSTEAIAFGSAFTPVRVVSAREPAACLTVRLPGGTELAVSDRLPVVDMVLTKLLQAESVQDAAGQPARSEGLLAAQGESQVC